MLCDCGNVYETLITQLLKGSTQVCWCTQRAAVKAARQRPEEQARVRAQAVANGIRTAEANKRDKTTHGLTRTHPLYVTWSGMMNRCFNPKQLAYRNYGGRGITVCLAWRYFGTFAAEIEQLIGLKPDPKLTLDRVNNDGNYEPGNVRWATRKEQQANKRRAQPGHLPPSSE
jgi:hypothetical protein